MDEVDKKIIGILKKDSRTSPAKIAEELGVAKQTVYNRISRLNDEGVIKKYTIQLGGRERLRAAFINPLRYLSDHNLERDLNNVAKEISENHDIVLALKVGDRILAVWGEGFNPESVEGVGRIEELNVTRVYKSV